MARHFYKLKPSKLDGTENVFEHQKYAALVLPTTFDLRPQCPPVYDQGAEGSCTANAGCAARSMLAGDSSLMLSRAFQYYMERFLEKDTDEDAGASMKDIGVAMKDYGVCLDSLMPYVVGDYKTPPTDADKKEALAYKIAKASMVKGINGIKTALVTRNQPVLVGMTVYESMESEQVGKTGVLPMPKENEEILGGHAVLAVGYIPALSDSILEKMHPFLVKQFSDEVQDNQGIEEIVDTITSYFTKKRAAGYLIVRNSWGAEWGDKGYFYMPYEYIIKGYANEFWILESKAVAPTPRARNNIETDGKACS